MTDPELVAKKLAFVETCLGDLKRLTKVEHLQDDLKEQRFVTYTLQIAIQAALDIASHIVSSERLGEPTTNRELFELAAGAGWIAPELSASLRTMSGFRNVVVHGYQEVDIAVVEDVFTNHLGDLANFCEVIRQRLDSEQDPSS